MVEATYWTSRVVETVLQNKIGMTFILKFNPFSRVKKQKELTASKLKRLLQTEEHIQCHKLLSAPLGMYFQD